MTIEQNLQKIQKRIKTACEKAGGSPPEGKPVAVSKIVSADAIGAAFNAGLRHFGESRVQEAASKIEQLQRFKPDIVWHMVGHLQTNKAKTAASIFDIIHSVDSLKLAETLNDSSRKKLRVLIQVIAA